MPTLTAQPGTLAARAGETAAGYPAAEFFAGIGLVRLGLEAAGFKVVWSNDIEPDKRNMYCENFQDTPLRHEFCLGDIGEVSGASLPANLSLAWGSFRAPICRWQALGVAWQARTPAPSGTSPGCWRRWPSAGRRSSRWRTSSGSPPVTAARTWLLPSGS